MSRSGAPGSQSSPPRDVDPGRPQENSQTSPTNVRMAMHLLQTDSPHPSQGRTGVALPPLQQISGSPPTPSSDRRRGNGPLGLQSMLNPQSEAVEQRNRRRSAAQMESPSPIDSTAPSLPSLSRPPSVDSAQEDVMLNRPFPGIARHSRHILSPRSPVLHRAQSLNMLNPPTGTIDAQQTPFLSPGTRSHMGEHVGSQAPPMPTPPAGTRAGYFTHMPSSVPTPPPGSSIRSELRRRSVGGFAQSGSASPMTSYSPYSQPASLASSGQFDHSSSSQSGSHMAVANATQGQDVGNPPITMQTERGYIPVGSTGQSSYQILTMKTHQGHHVQIPVDVQAASKVADEKRKRNAGASARFRARRKEKEREASSTIAKLEQQLRDAAEDVDFYRGERDHFRSIAYQHSGEHRHYPRPTSPRHRRLSATPSTGPSSTSGGGPGSYSGYSEAPEHRDMDRNVRRRTSSYHPVSAPPSAPLNGPGSQAQSYATPAFPTLIPAPQPGQLMNRDPSQQMDPRDQRQPQELNPHSSQGPTLRDPFAADTAHYENRGWLPGPSVPSGPLGPPGSHGQIRDGRRQ